MQSLKFLGNGSGFTYNHTNAFFEHKNNFILIDISMIHLEKLLSLKPYEKDNTFVFITHLHDDHISGLGLLIQYYYFVFKKEINICIPKKIKDDLVLDLSLKGILQGMYNVIEIAEYAKDENKRYPFDFRVYAIETSHVPELTCFSYLFEIDERPILYSGDTNTLSYYEKVMNLDDLCELYLDVSYLYGKVHIKYENVKDYLKNLSCEIYFIHIDDMENMQKEIAGSNFKIAQII